MAGRRKLIVVSNRGPVAFSRDTDGERVARRGGGGLVTALRSLVAYHDVTWIASAMSDEDRAVAGEADGEAIEERAGDGSPYRLRLVAHDPRAYDWYYNVVSNPVLWFAQHYLWGLASSPDVDEGLHHAWNEGYLAVNRSFADIVVSELERDPAAAVFFHDYHLYVAPALVRERVPDATLAHFVHIPWPQSDYWRVLPESIRRAVHEGVLANDVVSFHTSRWRRNFLRAAEEIVGADVDPGAQEARFGERVVSACACPISVDPAEFEELAASDGVRAEEARLEARRPEFLILRVDRTDPSKNIVRGFRAFARYLEGHPEMHGRVGMLALLDPSRQDIPEYAEYLGAVQRAVRVLNDRFQSDGWTPVDLVIEDNFMQSVAAYKQYDVLLVNAIFDGLNLVAKEAPLVNERDGVLILSENAGAHEELEPWVLTVNPFDIAGQADAIDRALTMAAEERRERIEAIRAHVREQDISAWIDSQLQDLDAARERAGSTLAEVWRNR
ncbi:MAG: trehalose-6-phosphate synthase [Actinobacteria bacterium]|nr:MAG: trehalose-6-phosphate synthase [Actinomycetota bacterium]